MPTEETLDRCEACRERKNLGRRLKEDEELRGIDPVGGSEEVVPLALGMLIGRGTEPLGSVDLVGLPARAFSPAILPCECDREMLLACAATVGELVRFSWC